MISSLSYFYPLITLFLLLWVTLYTFNPSIVQIVQSGDVYPVESANPDPMKCWIYSTIITATISLLIWGITRSSGSSPPKATTTIPNSIFSQGLLIDNLPSPTI